MFVPVDRFFLAIHSNDLIGAKLMLEVDGNTRLLNERDSKSGLCLLMVAALAGVPCGDGVSVQCYIFSLKLLINRHFVLCYLHCFTNKSVQNNFLCH